VFLSIVASKEHSVCKSERKIYEQKLSSVDAELITCADSSLPKYFRHEKHNHNFLINSFCRLI